MAVAAGLCTLAAAPAAHAWGDAGHEVVVRVAREHLSPRAAREMARLLALDDAPLRAHDGHLTTDDPEHAATWADLAREAERAGGRRASTIRSYRWHFADIEVHGGSLRAACAGFPGLPPGVPASQGPAGACIVEKIEQFAGELARPGVPDAERLVALKYVLHLVGDLHQPLHLADDHDHGGNQVALTVDGRVMSLHALWDQGLLRRLSRHGGPERLRAALPVPSAAQAAAWSGRPDVRAWAMESHAIAVEAAWPLAAGGRPSREALDRAADVAGWQLVKAGHRLAALLDATLGR